MSLLALLDPFADHTDFPTLPYTSASETPTLLYTSGLKKVLFSSRASPYGPLKEYTPPFQPPPPPAPHLPG